MTTPDYWVVYKIESIYKVLAGFSGGYLDGDYWQLNSGIVRVAESDDYYLFYGNSGSVYECRKGMYRIGLASAGIAHRLEKAGAELMSVDTDWLKLIKERV